MADLNLAKFKKIESDKKITKLKHDDGHILVIAHENLTPKLKKELDRLPMCGGGKVKMMADGGDPADVGDDVANASQSAANDTDALQSADAASPEGVSGVSLPTQANQNPPSVGGDIPQGQNQDLNQYMQTTQNILQDEDQKYNQDLYSGHIKPETYGSLFADKNTLGKVGTIFGLMLSGAGSGLSHQPNALLAAMDKQIQNDLDAQKTNIANKQNFYKLNMQNNLNNAQIQNLIKTGKYTDQQIRGLQLDNNFKAAAQSGMQMNGAAVHKLSQDVSSIPPTSPIRPQAEQALTNVSNAVQTKNASLAQQAAAQSALIKQQYGNPSIEEAAAQMPWYKKAPGEVLGDVASKLVMQPNPEASKATENKNDEFKNAVEKIPGDNILSPNADSLYNFAKANPYTPDMPALNQEYNQARQAESLLPRVHGIINDMFTSAQAGGKSDYIRRQTTPDVAAEIGTGAGAGIAGGVGAAVGRGVGAAENAILGPPSETNKAYSTAKSSLLNEIRAVLPNAGIEEVMNVVNSNAPEYNDSQTLLAKKEAAVKQFIRSMVQKGALGNRGMLAK